MTEDETRAEHIDPALAAAGWGVVGDSRVRRNFAIAPGRIEGAGRRPPPLRADYVLEYVYSLKDGINDGFLTPFRVRQIATTLDDYVWTPSDPRTRSERAHQAIMTYPDELNVNQRGFLNFVLGEYVNHGVDELDQEKLPPLLQLKYHAIADAAAELGSVERIRALFAGFQKYLYQPQAGA